MLPSIQTTKIFVVDTITDSVPQKVEGSIAYEISTKKLKIYLNSAWEDVSNSGVIYADTEENLLLITGEYEGQLAIIANGTLYSWLSDSWVPVGGSGLVNDVAANTAAIATLQGTVGNEGAGLVKDVADNESAISTLQTTVGEHTESISTIESTLANKANTSDVVLKTDIDTTVGASAFSSDTKVPSTKAVATAIEGIKTSLSGVYIFKGSATYGEIVAKVDAQIGDVWNSTTANGSYPAGTNYAWTGEVWDALGGEVDLSNYYNKSETDSAISAAVDPVSDALTTLEGEVDTNTSAIATINDTTIPGLQTSINGKVDLNGSNIPAEQVASWKSKLGFITADDQVQPDWNAVSGKGQILNKPDIKDTSVDGSISGIKYKSIGTYGDVVKQIRFGAFPANQFPSTAYFGTGSFVGSIGATAILSGRILPESVTDGSGEILNYQANLPLYDTKEQIGSRSNPYTFNLFYRESDMTLQYFIQGYGTNEANVSIFKEVLANPSNLQEPTFALLSLGDTATMRLTTSNTYEPMIFITKL